MSRRVPNSGAAGSRRARQRGNTMLEFAFVALPFLALVLATVDFGMALFIRATMQHAVREGVRTP